MLFGSIHRSILFNKFKIFSFLYLKLDRIFGLQPSFVTEKIDGVQVYNKLNRVIEFKCTGM
jgi:hypothetical protein